MTIDELFSWLDETTAYQAKSRSSSREAKDKPTDKKPTASRAGAGRFFLHRPLLTERDVWARRAGPVRCVAITSDG